MNEPGQPAPPDPLRALVDATTHYWSEWRTRTPYGQALTEAERHFWRAQVEMLKAAQALITARLGQLDSTASSPPKVEKIPVE